MSDTPPTLGQDPWGADLNTYLASLEARVAVLEEAPEYVFNSYSWKFSNAAPPAAAGELRLDNVNPALATLIDVRKIDGDGADRTPVFQQLTPGDLIRVNDWDNAAIFHRFNVTTAPTIGATNVTIPVTWTSGSGTLPTTGAAKINVAFLVSIIL